MRRRDVIIFFSVVLSVYGFIDYYIFAGGTSLLAGYPALRGWYGGIYLFLSLAFIVGRFLERWRITPVSAALIWLGSFWLAAMVYFLLIALAIDAVRLASLVVPLIPSCLSTDEGRINLLHAIISVVAMVVGAGAFNARTPRIRYVSVDIVKNAGSRSSLTIAVASDIHLGTIMCKARIERIVEMINSLNADVVLLPGDVVDEDVGPVIKQNLGETLRKIRAGHGVFAVTGNHEYIGGVEPACAYLSEHGMTMLRDSVVTIDRSFHIVGREDISYNRGRQRRRKSLEELLEGVEKSLPVILMDHQPFNLHEAEQNGVDLQLSGHTHHGQLWPFSYITRRVYEVSWGYKKKGNAHIYVSCGAGTWGPPVRTGNTPEIVCINVAFSQR